MTLSRFTSTCLAALSFWLIGLAPQYALATPQTKSLYLITAGSGKINNGLLTLNNVPAVMEFTDNQEKPTAYSDRNIFISKLRRSMESNDATSLHAVLAIYTETGATNAVFEISKPIMTETGINMQAKILQGTSPTQFTYATLFIVIHEPLMNETTTSTVE